MLIHKLEQDPRSKQDLQYIVDSINCNSNITCNTCDTYKNRNAHPAATLNYGIMLCVLADMSGCKNHSLLKGN